MALRTLTRFYTLNEGFFAFNIKYLFLVGLWPEDDLTENQRLMYTMYKIVIYVLTIFFLIITGIGSYDSRNNLTRFFSNLDTTIVAFNFFLKANIFLYKKDKLKTLIEEIESSGDVITERSKKLMRAPVFIITGSSLIIVGSFSALAIFKGEMTIEAWMPFDPLKDRMSLILSAKILALLIMPGLFRAFAMQGIVCSIVIYLCDQLILLQAAIKNLKYTKKTEMLTRRQLKDVIKKHIRLMGYSRAMEAIFKEYFLVQNLAVTLELCLNAVMVTTIRDFTIMSFLAYLGLALTNAYIYCYLGNELILQSRGIVLAAYEAPWTSWPLDMRKDLLILITASQKPMALSAGGITIVSLPTFGKTLYDGYSIFAVLNDMVD